MLAKNIMGILLLIFALWRLNIEILQHYRDNVETKSWVHNDAIILNTSAEVRRLSRGGIINCFDVHINYDYGKYTYKGYLEMQDNCINGLDLEQAQADAWIARLYPTGQHIFILVNPKDPEKARSLDFSQRSSSRLLPLDIFFLFLGIGLILAKNDKTENSNSWKSTSSTRRW